MEVRREAGHLTAEQEEQVGRTAVRLLGRDELFRAYVAPRHHLRQLVRVRSRARGRSLHSMRRLPEPG